MYIFRMLDGSLVEAPKEFNPDKPDFDELKDVLEVLVISKVLEKQLRLVPKARQERSALLEQSRLEAAPTAEAEEVQEPKKKRRG